MADKTITVRLNFVVDASGVAKATDEVGKLAEGAKTAEKHSKKASDGIMAGFLKAAVIIKVAKEAYRALIDGFKATKEGDKALGILTESFTKVKVALASGLMPYLEMFVKWLTSNLPVITSVAAQIGKVFGIAATFVVQGFRIIVLGFQTMMEKLMSGAAWIAEKLGFEETAAKWKKASDDWAASADKNFEGIKQGYMDLDAQLKKPIKALTMKPTKADETASKAAADARKKAEKDAKDAADKEFDRSKEYAESIKELSQQIEESKIEAMEDGLDKRLTTLDYQYGLEYAKADELKAYTLEEYQKKNDLLLAMTEKYESDRAAIQDTWAAEQQQKENDAVVAAADLYVIDYENQIYAFQEKMGKLYEYAAVAQEISQQVMDIISQITTAEVNEITSAAEKKKQEAKNTIKNKKQLDAELAKIDAEAAKKEKEARETEAAMAIVMAVINTAVGVTKALASTSPPLSYVFAALTAAAGIAEIAVIASQSFAEGGVVEGESETGDRITARVNAGEMILNKPQQQRLLALAEGKTISGRGSVTVGGDTIIIQGNASDDAINAIRQTREDQLRDLRQMLLEVEEYSG